MHQKKCNVCNSKESKVISIVSEGQKYNICTDCFEQYRRHGILGTWWLGKKLHLNKPLDKTILDEAMHRYLKNKVELFLNDDSEIIKKMYCYIRLQWLKRLKVGDQVYYSDGRHTKIERIFTSPKHKLLGVLHMEDGNSFSLLGTSQLRGYEIFILKDKPERTFARILE